MTRSRPLRFRDEIQGMMKQFCKLDSIHEQIDETRKGWGDSYQVWCDGASGDVGTDVAFVTLWVERLSDWRLEMSFCVVSWAGLSSFSVRCAHAGLRLRQSCLRRVSPAPHITLTF